MPINNVPLLNVEQSISRPVVQSVIEQVRKATRMKEGLKVFYPGDSQIMQSQGGALANDGTNKAQFESGEYLFVEVEEEIDDEELNINPVSRGGYKPIFLDEACGVMLRPTYQRVKVTINFKYQSKNKSVVQRWRTNMITRLTQDARVNLHDLHYSITLPQQYQRLIEEIHANREAEAPYGDSLIDYINRCIDKQTTVLSNQEGGQRELAFTYTDSRVVGQFDFSTIPDKPEYDQAEGTHTVTFPYKFNYHRASEVTAHYPVIIHNCLLPNEFIVPVDTQRKHAAEGPYNSRNHYMEEVGHFEINETMEKVSKIGGHLRIPYYDDHTFIASPSGFIPLLSCLNSVDPENPRKIIDLKEDLGEYVIDDDIKEFMIAEGDKILRPYDSVFYLSYHRWQVLRGEGLSMNDLVLSNSEDLNPRDCHRVRLDICAALHRLPHHVIERIRANPVVFVKLVSCLNSELAKQPFVKDFINRRVITEADFNFFYALYQGFMTHNLRPKTGMYYGSGIQASPTRRIGPKQYVVDQKALQAAAHMQFGLSKTLMHSFVVGKRMNQLQTA